MDSLATLYRAAQFVAHRAHHLCAGATFFQDHEFFGELYSVYEDAYDSLIERMIGLGQSPGINEITLDAARAAASHNATEVDRMFSMILNVERSFCTEITKIQGKQTPGTQNLLQGLADESEARQYKIRQRVA